MNEALLRKIYSNEELKLGYYPKNSYNETVTTGQFTELTYNNKPVLNTQLGTQINRVLYSVLFEDVSFSNAVTLQLFNKTVEEATGPTTTREVSFSSQLKETGFEFKDYTWRLYYLTGGQYYTVYTGEVQKTTISETTIAMKLNSRVANLADRDGSDTKTSYAGWNTNIGFSDALNLLLEDTNIKPVGDIDTIDYGQTINEGDLDLLGANNSGHISYYDENEIYVCGKGIFNFVNGTFTDIGLTGNIHFHFVGTDGHHYFVYDKLEPQYRRGEYIYLYLYDADIATTYDLGMGRASEVIGDDLSNFDTMSAMENNICRDTRFEYNYQYISHVYGSDTQPEEQATMSEVYASGKSGDSYFCPITSVKAVFTEQDISDSNSFSWTTDRNKVYLGGYQENPNFGGKEFKAASLNAYAADGFYLDTFNKDKAQSYKNRGYFYYDPLQNRLFFQRASNLMPSGSSYTLGSNMEKSWDNFGLNPIGFYSLSSNTLGYSNITNDLFFEDFLFANNTAYAIGMDIDNLSKYNNLKQSNLYRISNAGTITQKWGLVNYEMYGISFFNDGSNDYLSFVTKDSSDNWNWRYSTDDSTLQLLEIGSADFYNAPTSLLYASGDIILVVFKDKQLTIFKPFDQVNNVKYIGEVLENSLGGYLVKNKLTDDYSGRVQNNIISAVSEVRVEVLDLTDLNKLQALLKLLKMSNKFMTVDENDTLQIYNASNVDYNFVLIDKFKKFEKLDYEGYKSVLVKTYNAKREDLFEWSYESVEDFEGDVRGRWYGPDGSFTVSVKITSSSSFEYSITSSASRLVRGDTIYSGITNWKNISIDLEDSNFTLKFVDDEFDELPPSADMQFTMIFNTSILSETASPLQETDVTLDLIKTKTIDNVLVSPNNSTFLLEDINDFFISEKNMYKATVLEPYVSFDLMQKVNINYPYEGVNFEICYITKATINNDGLTELILIQE